MSPDVDAHGVEGESPASVGGKAFPVVGIGASAGGLGALEAFFSALPKDGPCGMAFVVVQHLAPDHPSLLASLIQRFTSLRVQEVKDGMKPEVDCAYVIPPNKDLVLRQGRLRLLEPTSPRGLRLPIDGFFRSLAEDHREKAIGIVLSGTGSDGTLGARAIKGEGGLVMAQAPESAEYDGMPLSVLATGLVDYTLPPADMPRELTTFIGHAFGRAAHPSHPLAPGAEEALAEAFALLRARTGHDFSQYKRTTTCRRIERRMAVHQIDRLDGYVGYLRQNPAETEALFRDLLIGVTHFFRDSEAFEALGRDVLAPLLRDKPADGTLRVWVPGCSTGEEAYSIAILIHEQMEALACHLQVQVFATDLDQRAIDHARLGLYPASIVADVSADRLARFFTAESDGAYYRIRKPIRNCLVFSPHNLIKDPPFSKLDVISCRNLLIYMGGALQRKLIPLFHYALNPGGFLFLGTSESVGEYTALFSALDRKAKIFQGRPVTPGSVRPEPGAFHPPRALGSAYARSARPVPGGTKPPWKDITERALFQHHGSTGALVNERGDILYLHGRTGRFLEPSPGDAGMNILKMAREGLRGALTAALHKAVAHQEIVQPSCLMVKTNGDFTPVQLTLRPVEAVASALSPSRLYLVVLEDVPEPQEEALAQSGGHSLDVEGRSLSTEMGTHLEALKEELRAKEDYLQSTNEQLEISNAELMASNEEMQSVNEELQSTNEELETSKEELQSVNEEMATVNAELQQKVEELSRATNDMNNLLSGTGVGTIFVDHQLRIQRFTPAATQVMNLIPTDVGRPVGDLGSNLVNYDGLIEDIQAVLEHLTPKELEVQTKGGCWYLLRIRPYRTLENVIEGAVITLAEITSTIQAREALHRLAMVVRDSADAITMQDLTGRILAWNPGAERLFGWSAAEALTLNVRDRIPEQQRAEEWERLHRLAEAEVLAPYEAARLTKDGRSLKVSIMATALLHGPGQVYAIATTERLGGVPSHPLPESPLPEPIL